MKDSYEMFVEPFEASPNKEMPDTESLFPVEEVIKKPDAVKTRRLERHSKHIVYKLSDGTPAVGASTIAGIHKPVGPLMGWAAKLAREGKDYKKEMNQAADYGTIAHFLIEAHLANEEADLTEFTDEEIAVAKIAYNKFLEFWEKSKLKHVSSEVQMVSEQHRYGGTIDLIAASERDELFLFDYKTSKAVYESHGFQVSGYFRLWNENRPETPVSRAAIVRVGRNPKDAFEIHWIPPSRMEAYWECFIARLAVYNADKKAHY